MKKIYENYDFPPILKEDIDVLVNAVNSGKDLIDCEQSQLLGSINMAENMHWISPGLAEELRIYYVFTMHTKEE